MVARRIACRRVFHVGPAYELACSARAFPCAIEIRTSSGTFDAKSGLKILQARLVPEKDLEVRCSGEREEEALEIVCELIGRHA